jgi:hypothetical protein
MSDQTTTPNHAKRNPVYDWLLAVILAFVLGFLLAWWLFRQHPVAPPMCPHPAASTAATQPANKGNAAMHGGGAPGTGSPTQLGAKGGGDGSVSGNAAEVTGDGAGVPPGGGGKGDPIRPSVSPSALRARIDLRARCAMGAI